MKDIQKPLFMQRAAQGKRGHLAVIEILIALLVFLVSSLAMGIIQVPLFLVHLMTNEEYMKLAMQGDMESLQEMTDIMTQMPEWMLIAILLSEILMITVVILYCLWLEKRRPDTMGFRKQGMIRQYASGVIGGLLFFSAAYLLCTLTGSIHFDGLASTAAPVYIIGYLAGYLIQGMAEEVLCRGYLFVSLTRRYPLTYSILISALFFAFLHGMNAGITFLAVINLTLFGIFAALLLVKYENIWIVGAFHSIWNFAQGNLYGIQVSGNALQPSVFASTTKESMSLINGGKFGMEGGLAVTLVLGMGIAYLIWSLGRAGKIVDLPQAALFQNVMGNMPQGMNVPQDRNMPQGGNVPQDRNMPQGGNVPQDRNMSQGGSVSQGMNAPQDAGMSQGEKMPSSPGHPTQSPGADHPQDRNMPQAENAAHNQRMMPPRRENMGVRPGETPWHPEQAGRQDASGQNQTTFNADYFKD